MIEVIPCSAVHETAWREFLQASDNGTLFHRLDFLRYHPAGRFAWHHLMFYDSGKLVALLPAGIVEEADGRRFLVSPCGASVGGLVLPPRQSLPEAIAIVTSLQEYAAANGFSGIEMRIGPNIYAQSPNDSAGFCLARQGFLLVRRWLSHVIPLPRNPEDVPGALVSGRRRGYVTAAMRQGLTVEPAGRQKLAPFYAMLEENRAKFSARPTHTLAELEALFTLTPESLELFVCEHQGQIIAGTLVFILNRQVAYSFYPCHDRAFEKLRAATLVAVKVAEHYALRGFSYVDLGPSTGDQYEFTGGLCRFKEEVGGVGFCRDTWRWEAR